MYRRSAGPAFARDGGIFKVVSDGPPLGIEGLAFDNTNQGAQLAVEVTGKRDVVLKDIISAGVALLNRRAQGGRVFLEDVCCGRMEVAGPNPVVARQFDTEGGGTRVTNRGQPIIDPGAQDRRHLDHRRQSPMARGPTFSAGWSIWCAIRRATRRRPSIRPDRG